MSLLHFTRTLSGLSPADDYARKRLAKIPLGVTVGMEYKVPRNGPMHRRYWALCQMVYDNVEGYGSAEVVSDHLKILSGHCEAVASRATGEVYLLPKSIRFAAMDQAGFDAFWDRVVKAICEHILPGVTVPEIEMEIMRLIGAAG
jgi:hypothetical protein